MKKNTQGYDLLAESIDQVIPFIVRGLIYYVPSTLSLPNKGYTMTELISYDDAIDVAYDIFLEMAPDNLEPADVILFTAQFEDRGAAELVETGDDWVQEVGFEVDKEVYAEIRIGLVNETDDVLDDVFARLLISRDPDNRSCHALWKRD